MTTTTPKPDTSTCGGSTRVTREDLVAFAAAVTAECRDQRAPLSPGVERTLVALANVDCVLDLASLLIDTRRRRPTASIRALLAELVAAARVDA